MTNYKSFNWDSENLTQCKNTVISMIIAGIGEDIILSLDFGNLDVVGVIDSL